MSEREPTLAELADRHDEAFGDYERLRMDGRSWRSLELSDLARRLAGGLAGLGLAPGERVLVMLPNGPEVGPVYGGVWRAGGVVTPVLFLLTPPEVARVVREAEPAVAVTGPEFLDVVRRAAEGSGALRHVVCTGAAPEGTVALDGLLANDPLPHPVPREPGDLAALLFTGGTTGASKGVMLSHRNIAANARAAAAVSEVGEDEIALTALPLAHGYGVLVTAVGLLVRGMAVLQRWFDPIAFLELAQEHRVTRLAVVPTMLQSLLQAPLERYDLSALRHVTCGAASLPPEVRREWEERTGSIVLEGYGCTEAVGAVAVNRPSVPRRPGSVGLPVPGVEVRIVDGGGRELPPGKAGEIAVRGPNVMAGYWRQPEETAGTIRAGWLHTGDVGRLDGDGHLYVLERKKDLIIRGGVNIYPRDLEEALAEHPAVAMAGVVGRPDPRYGEEAVAFVVRAPGAEVTGEDLLAFLAERVGRPKRPREIRFVPALPLTPVGKVSRRDLRALL